jgi:hypothetical protein
VDQREVDIVLGLHRPRRRELRLGQIDADRASTPACQPRRPVGGAAAELDHVEPVDVAQDPELLLANFPDPPRRRIVRPQTPSGRLVLSGDDIPGGAIAPCMLGQLHRLRVSRADAVQ